MFQDILLYYSALLFGSCLLVAKKKNMFATLFDQKTVRANNTNLLFEPTIMVFDPTLVHISIQRNLGLGHYILYNCENPIGKNLFLEF